MNVTCNIFINSFGSVTETTMVRVPVSCFYGSVNGGSQPDSKHFHPLLSSSCFMVMSEIGHQEDILQPRISMVKDRLA